MQSCLNNKINFILTPSLQYRALAKIAITLWSQNDVKDFLNERFHYYKDGWQEIEKFVVWKAAKLQMPEIFKKKLLDFIVPVGLQILSWLELHHDRYRLVTVLPANLFWTSLGTIDVKRTAEVLVKDEKLRAHERFKLACMYCLEDAIRDLWERFALRGSGYTQLSRLDNPHLVMFWSHYLEVDQWMRLDPYTQYEWAFLTTALRGDALSTLYFMQRLNPEDKDELIMEIAEYLAYCVGEHDDPVEIFLSNTRSDILLLLLSAMDAQQQADIFKEGTYGVLKSLLAWPWQSLLLETACKNWNCLSKENYCYLLHNIVDSTNYNLNYPSELFEEFWKKSPEAYKQYFTERDSRILYGRWSFRSLLLKLCRKKDEINIKLILKDSSISAKKRFIFMKAGRNVCRHLVSRKKWDSVKYLIQECIPSRKEMISYRDLIKNRKIRFSSETEYKNVCIPNWCISNLCNPYVWDNFLELIEDCILGYKKRKNMQDTTSSKTHFCKNIVE